MGRRSLRKIDPELDLSAHLKTLDELPNPWDPTVLFGRSAPLEVEVGSGKGLFMRSAAASQPDHDFLGIEVARRYASFAASRLAKRKLTNAVIVSGDAQRMFQELLTDNSVTAVHIYFPDPWWKKRHHKRRVMNETFVADVARTLMPGGTLHFWTDVNEYFELSLEMIGEHTTLAGPFDVAQRPAEHDLDYRTHFERRVRQSDQPVYRAEFRKVT